MTRPHTSSSGGHKVTLNLIRSFVGKPVYLRWRDIRGQAGWLDTDAIDSLTTAIVESLGWIVELRKTDDHYDILTAADRIRDSEELGNTQIIPVGCLVEIKDIDL